jgi:hypothetical protein
MYFPAVCFDNFFNRPDEVREFALSLKFETFNDVAFPGKRTQPLHLISQNYFELFSKKVLSLFAIDDDCRYECETSFQLIEPYETSGIKAGWVHNDVESNLAGVIYLTPNIHLNNGTSIFRPKKIFDCPINYEYKREMYLNSNGDKEQLEIKRIENNNLFEETMIFKNVYNRLVAYDSKNYHAQTSFEGSEKDLRLTQVFFFHKIYSSNFPGPSCKQIQL